MKLRQLITQRKLTIALAAIFLLIIVVLFSIRGMVLNKAISSLNGRLLLHGYTANWKDPQFKGLRTIFIKEVYIKSSNDQNEAVFDSLSVSVRILPLLIKNLRIREINCRSISVRHSIADTLITDIKNQKKDNLNDHWNKIDFADFANKNIRRLFHYLPQRINLGSVDLKTIFAGNSSSAGLDNLRLKRNGLMSAQLVFSGNDTSIFIPVSGKLDKRAYLLELNLVNTSGSLLPIPFLQDRYGVSTGFDSLNVFLDLSARNRQLVKVNGLFNFSGFELNGERISTETIRIKSFRSSFNIKLGPDYLEIDSTSTGYLNEIKVNPYLKVSFRPDPVIAFKILPQTWSADKFFRSLPQGMFTSVTGIKTEGLLNYYLNFFIELKNTDSLYFDTRLTSDDFSIVSYVTDDYRVLNNSFRHQVYERGRLVTAFAVGSENPDFVSIADISPYLRSSVMTSEDGSFFYHNGFNPGAFRESMVTNIKEKRFARGGSTITMQLVKNVFLTRNKTLARKIEEALIVWMIENKNLVSKERMYEVYLNIIEWGPGIYGINQASHFYFNKKPADLSLGESIYLASIVPHPKWYKYSFIHNGELKPFYSNYFNRMKELMVRKQFINSTDTLGVQRNVLLTGRAASVFASNMMDSVILDLLFIPPEF
jgi:hypothetical protein